MSKSKNKLKIRYFLLCIILTGFIAYSCNNNNKKDTVKNIVNSVETKVANNFDNSEYVGPHHYHEQQFGDIKFASEEQWDSLNGIVFSNPDKKTHTRNKDYKTFGWHLYSNGTAYKEYNYSLLWAVSYFSYPIDPETGSYKNIHQWKTTALVDSAKSYGCKVFLTISNFGGENNSIFLKNDKAQETLTDSLISLLNYRNADGINIDFEGMQAANRDDFSAFIQKISENLKEENPDFMISLCLYAIDYQHVFDIPAIDKHIDFYTLMAYDYYGGFSSHAGPVTPFGKSISFGSGCMKNSVDYYLNQGVKPEKLIVGMPYYGAEWIVKNFDLPSKAEEFCSHPPYRTVKSYFIDSLNTPVSINDSTSCSYCNIHISDSIKKQLWFDDTVSLAVKYDWVVENKLAGIGIWALGYDNGHDELWKLIADKFTAKE